MDHCRNASKPETVVDRALDPTGPADGERRSVGERDDSSAGGVGVADESGSATRRDLDAWVDELRQRHLATALATLEHRDALDAGDRAAIAACSRAIIHELLRGPRRGLRTDGEEFGPAAAWLFDLDSE